MTSPEIYNGGRGSAGRNLSVQAVRWSASSAKVEGEAGCRTAITSGTKLRAMTPKKVTMVGVAQLVRVPDCDSGCRGFESHRPPQLCNAVKFASTRGAGDARSFISTPNRGSVAGHATFWFEGPLAQLVEQQTLNLLVLGSSPRRPTTFSANVHTRSHHRACLRD